MTLVISFGGGAEVAVELRSDSTSTLRSLSKALPFETTANRWGDEIYFETPVRATLEKDAREVMEVGEVAFWPAGSAVAIFFGRTPASTDDRPRAYSPCNIVGRVTGDLSRLKSVQSGERVRIFNKE